MMIIVDIIKNYNINERGNELTEMIRKELLRRIYSSFDYVGGH